MASIPISEVYDTAIRFTLNGVEAESTFPVSSRELERIETIFNAATREGEHRRQFIMFDTLNGWTVAIRLAMIEKVHVRLDPIRHDIEYESAAPSTLLCNFGDKREVLNIAPPYPEDVAALTIDFDDGIDTMPRHFISVRNEDDEWLYLGVEHIRIVQMSTNLVTEGHRIIREDMHSGTDNGGEDGSA